MSAIDRLEAEEHLHTAVREMREAGADDKEIHGIVRGRTWKEGDAT